MSRHEAKPNEAAHARAATLMDGGLELHRLGHHDDSLRCFDAAIKAVPGLAMAHYGKGFEMSCLGRHGEAIPCFEDALKIDPDLAEAHYEKGCSLSRLRKYEEAAECLGNATRLKPDHAMAHYEKGFALIWLKRRDEAVCCLRCGHIPETRRRRLAHSKGNRAEIPKQARRSGGML